MGNQNQAMREGAARSEPEQWGNLAGKAEAEGRADRGMLGEGQLHQK